jgi:hypothetical protein
MIKKNSIYSPFVYVIPPSAVADFQKFKQWYSIDYLNSIEGGYLFSTRNGNLISFTDTIFGKSGNASAKLKIIDQDGDFYRNYLDNEYAEAMVRLCQETVAGDPIPSLPGPERSVYIAYGFDSDPQNISLKRYLITSIFTYKGSDNVGMTELDLAVTFTEPNTTRNTRSLRLEGSLLEEDKTKKNFNMNSINAVLGQQFFLQSNPRTGGVGYRYIRNPDIKKQIETLFEEVIRTSVGLTFDEQGIPYESTLVKVDINPSVVAELTKEQPAANAQYASDPLVAKLKDYGIEPYRITGQDSIFLRFNPNWTNEDNIRSSVIKAIKKMYTDAGSSFEVDATFINELKDVATYHKIYETGTNEQVIIYVSDKVVINSIIDQLNKANKDRLNSFAIDNQVDESVASELVGVPVLVQNGRNSNILSLSQKKNANEYVKTVSAGLLKGSLLYSKLSSWVASNSNDTGDIEERKQEMLEKFRAAFDADPEFVRIREILKANIKGFDDSASEKVKKKGEEAIEAMFKSGQQVRLDPKGFSAYFSLMDELKNYSVKYAVVKTVPMAKHMNSLVGLRPAVVVANEHFLSDGYISNQPFERAGDTYLSGIYKIRSITTRLSPIESYTEFDLLQTPTTENTINS